MVVSVVEKLIVIHGAQKPAILEIHHFYTF